MSKKNTTTTLRHWEMKNGACLHNGIVHRYSVFHYLGEPTEWMVELINTVTGEIDSTITILEFLTEDYTILS